MGRRSNSGCVAALAIMGIGVSPYDEGATMQNDDFSFAGSRRTLLKSAAALAGGVFLPFAAHAADEKYARLDRESKGALKTLYSRNAGAKALGAQAVAVLVFPRVTKAGFVVGGQYGDGALLKGGNPVGYYSTAGVSYGMQAGAQNYGYAMFFMNDNALSQLDKAGGLEIGVGPSIVFVDDGMARNLTTTTAKDDIYAFVFSQKGLMAGVGLQGNKISRL